MPIHKQKISIVIQHEIIVVQSCITFFRVIPYNPNILIKYKYIWKPIFFFFFFFQNYPLFIKTVHAENELLFYYTVHTSLDVVEEKISSVGKNQNDLKELYLGILYPTEDYKVYPLFCLFWNNLYRYNYFWDALGHPLKIIRLLFPDWLVKICPSQIMLPVLVFLEEQKSCYFLVVFFFKHFWERKK